MSIVHSWIQRQRCHLDYPAERLATRLYIESWQVGATSAKRMSLVVLCHYWHRGRMELTFLCKAHNLVWKRVYEGDTKEVLQWAEERFCVFDARFPDAPPSQCKLPQTWVHHDELLFTAINTNGCRKKYHIDNVRGCWHSFNIAST